MSENKYGTEVQGKVIAVIDYNNKVQTFSKLLTKKEKEAYEDTKYLPDGVTVNTSFAVVETFDTQQEAQAFIARGGKKKPEYSFGIFKSKAQYKLAKRLVASK